MNGGEPADRDAIRNDGIGGDLIELTPPVGNVRCNGEA